MARAIWEEVVKGIGPSATALMERIDDLCDPERIEDANMLEEMREKYRNEITVRTKSSWWRKLLQVSGRGWGSDLRGGGRNFAIDRKSGYLIIFD